MVQIDFYNSSSQTVEKFLPRFLEKIITNKVNALLVFKNKEVLDFYNRYLWTFSTKIFLPHGSSEEKYCKDQPIYLTTDIDDNANNSKILISIDELKISNILKFDRFAYIFSSTNENTDRTVSDYYNSLKNECDSLTFWQQDGKCKWESKKI